MSKLWGGRFKKKTDPLVEKFSSSISVDYRLAKYDVWGSLIHVRALKKSKIISSQEEKKLTKGLLTILKDVEKGRFKFNLKSEDIHTNIQNVLQKKIGKAADKLHTLRSRNDQVVFDTKVFCKEELINICFLIDEFLESFLSIAEKNKTVKLPGYTHMQHAQPINFTDYVVAYGEMFSRDYERVGDVLSRINIFLGSGALAGSPIKFSVYKQATSEIAKKLKLTLTLSKASTIDNVSDRDFVVETLSTLAILGMHLSRLAEDLIIFSTKEFGFIELGDAFCTGSSFMPQKKNPDSLELIRGYSGKLYGNLVSVLTTMKALPLAYNRDMQLDKEPLFSSIDVVKDELKILSNLIKSIGLKKENIKRQLADESLYAVDLAKYLVGKNISFKAAHAIVGRLIKYSIEKKKKIINMSDKELKRFSSKFSPNIMKRIINVNIPK